MKSFWSYITNRQYTASCTNQSVYLYGQPGIELKYSP